MTYQTNISSDTNHKHISERSINQGKICYVIPAKSMGIKKYGSEIIFYGQVKISMFNTLISNNNF